MRKTLLALAALAAFAATAPAQGGWADKMFKEGTTHDFGSVPRGTQSMHRFKIVNIYAVDMDLTRLKASCGCVVATSPKKTLAPREESYIEVRMDGTRYSGPKTVTVDVTVGPKFVSTAQLRVSANGRADVVFSPGQVNFGLVAAGTAATKTVDLEYAGPLKWELSEVVVKDLPYDISAKETFRGPGRVKYSLTVGLKSDAPVGVLKHEILLKTNDKASPVVPLLVEAIVQSSLTVTPKSFNLGAVVAGDSLRKRVIVSGSGTFKILGVDGLDKVVENEKGIPADNADRHLLEFRVNVPEGPFRKELKIRTSAQEAPLVVVIEGVATK